MTQFPQKVAGTKNDEGRKHRVKDLRGNSEIQHVFLVWFLIQNEIFGET